MKIRTVGSTTGSDLSKPAEMVAYAVERQMTGRGNTLTVAIYDVLKEKGGNEVTDLRLANPPREIEMETDRLLDEWADSDSPLSFQEYRFLHASEKTKAYLKLISNISDEEG